MVSVSLSQPLSLVARARPPLCPAAARDCSCRLVRGTGTGAAVTPAGSFTCGLAAYTGTAPNSESAQLSESESRSAAVLPVLRGRLLCTRPRLTSAWSAVGPSLSSVSEVSNLTDSEVWPGLQRVLPLLLSSLRLCTWVGGVSLAPSSL